MVKVVKVLVIKVTDSSNTESFNTNNTIKNHADDDNGNSNNFSTTASSRGTMRINNRQRPQHKQNVRQWRRYQWKIERTQFLRLDN